MPTLPNPLRFPFWPPPLSQLRRNPFVLRKPHGSGARLSGKAPNCDEMKGWCGGPGAGGGGGGGGGDKPFILRECGETGFPEVLYSWFGVFG